MFRGHQDIGVVASFPLFLPFHFSGPGHVLECMGLFSMDVKVATPWKCHGCKKMAFHGNTRLTCTKCTPGDSLENFHGIAELTLVVPEWLSFSIKPVLQPNIRLMVVRISGLNSLHKLQKNFGASGHVYGVFIITSASSTVSFKIFNRHFVTDYTFKLYTQKYAFYNPASASDLKS